MVSTTINMHSNTREGIRRAARTRNTTQKEVIAYLLQRLMRDVDKYQAGFWGVRYQTDVPKKGWHRYFIRFREEEYEYFTDLRKLCKHSVAFLIAIAVENYLNESFEENNKARYNYCSFPGYSLAKKVINDIECWLRYWGPYQAHESGSLSVKLIGTTCPAQAGVINQR